DVYKRQLLSSISAALIFIPHSSSNILAITSSNEVIFFIDDNISLVKLANVNFSSETNNSLWIFYLEYIYHIFHYTKRSHHSILQLYHNELQTYQDYQKSLLPPI
ncbi:hypothetical protein, partial [Actinobacillus suis]|uniref:hypothetical protein n=1 Tax=Actinobacillus suis TaxID=716 RepID=UPI00211EA05B